MTLVSPCLPHSPWWDRLYFLPWARCDMISSLFTAEQYYTVCTPSSVSVQQSFYT